MKRSKPVLLEDKVELASRLAVEGTDYVDSILIDVERECTVGMFRGIAERFEAIVEALR